MKGKVIGMYPGVLDQFYAAHSSYVNTVREDDSGELPPWVTRKLVRGLQNWRYGNSSDPGKKKGVDKPGK